MQLTTCDQRDLISRFDRQPCSHVDQVGFYCKAAVAGRMRKRRARRSPMASISDSTTTTLEEELFFWFARSIYRHGGIVESITITIIFMLSARGGRMFMAWYTKTGRTCQIRDIRPGLRAPPIASRALLDFTGNKTARSGWDCLCG